MSTDLLQLTTALRETEKFLVDGEEFEMLSTDNLSIEDEALVQAWLSRHNILATELALERNPTRGQQIAIRLRDSRLRVIGKMTTLPKEKAAGLPTSQQALLLEALAKLIQMPEADEDDIAALAGDDDEPVSGDAVSDID